ncbi:AbrB/MazE/SpoVT family DNA-binding domain-containing protein [Halobellus captivus]|uniref:AbrB/MazE/SpoVT family DNA-binding domain-containing protein n=1 Tax=Halobellus captivus TaxID=2592614 RepID=UPI0011A2C70F|nr:AbrB/MazE/SpoVT family DNA-binding domain-containing protein [Halobellus captivus]
MPRVTANGQVTIPKRIRETLGIELGDEVAFEQTESGYTLGKEVPTIADGKNPFKKYRGSAESDDTMSDRMRRLRGECPRDVSRIRERNLRRVRQRVHHQ